MFDDHLIDQAFAAIGLGKRTPQGRCDLVAVTLERTHPGHGGDGCTRFVQDLDVPCRIEPADVGCKHAFGSHQFEALSRIGNDLRRRQTGMRAVVVE